jgi:hypothetical protein
MTGGDTAGPADDLVRDSRNVRSKAGEVQAQVLRVAETVAKTEEEVAATLERLAKDRPHRAEHLRALSLAAREQAARERQWAQDHGAGAAPRDGGDD